MLGFDALGRLALGELPVVSGSVVLTANAGSFTYSGQAALFKVGQVSAARAFVLAGQAVAFKVSATAAARAFTFNGQAASFATKLTSAVGSFALAGQVASFSVTFAGAPAAYAFTGRAAALNVGLGATTGGFTIAGQGAAFSQVWSLEPGSFAVTFNDAELVRTGGDYDQVYGGVGHYLEELQRQKQLNAITRKAPPPIRRALPQLPPPRPTAAPAIDLQAVAAQRAQQEMAQREPATAKRRRQEAEILLLAS